MVRSPIGALIDAADLRCTRCGAPQSIGCRCWRKVMLRCPKCGRKQQTTAELDDPPAAETIIIQCPKCNAGDFDSPKYVDADGKEILWRSQP